MRKRVAVLFGARSLESDISVITAMQALYAIDRSKYIVEPIYMYEGEFYWQGVDALEAFTNFQPSAHEKLALMSGQFFAYKRNKLKRAFKPDVALVCCHGGEGENGTLQALLEFNRIKCTSPRILGSAIAMDKALSKMFFKALGLNVLPYSVVNTDESDAQAAARLEMELGYPMIVKPATLGSSIGISAARDREELIYSLGVARQFDDKLVVEKLLEECDEVNCAAVRDGDDIIISATEQPTLSGDFLSFDDKYMTGGKQSEAKHVIPAPIGALEEDVKAATECIYRALDLVGVVRADFLLDKNGKLYINELNTVPGSLAFYLFEPIGISFGRLLDILISGAVTDDSNVYRFFKTPVLKAFAGGAKGAKSRGEYRLKL